MAFTDGHISEYKLEALVKVGCPAVNGLVGRSVRPPRFPPAKNIGDPCDICYIYLHEWLIFVVNAGKYTIHGWYGKCKVTSGVHIFSHLKRAYIEKVGRKVLYYYIYLL